MKPDVVLTEPVQHSLLLGIKSSMPRGHDALLSGKTKSSLAIFSSTSLMPFPAEAFMSTQGNWQLLNFLYIFLNANTPVWLAYPKGSKPPSDLAATLALSKEAIQSVQCRYQTSAPGPS
ncbi:hypothetical protein QCA50_007987 [Cerrena zonata]|uniref:Uncharacterized protein n=1 Tax=Cerrena zonata TaxID=2478898 RepID=A0AAW0GEM1_9APHY